MLSPSFWLSKVSNADQIVLSSNQIDKLNREVYRKGHLIYPLTEEEYISGKRLKNYFQTDLAWIRNYIKYDKNKQRRRDPAFSAFLESLIDIENIPHRKAVIFGLLIRSSDLRVFPTDMILTRKPEGSPFDILQKSTLSINDEVAILYHSRDKKWVYVEASIGTGWIKRKALAIDEKEKIENYLQTMKKSLVVASWADFYPTLAMKTPSSRLPMGNRIRILQKQGEIALVLLPSRNSSDLLTFVTNYTSAEGVSDSPLAFTRANVLKQAFRLLGEPYAWGGKGLHTDCSGYLQRVFRTMSLILPRNSTLQIKYPLHWREVAGKEKEKEKIISRLPPILSLLHCPGPTHIMLYLGNHEGTSFFIHNLWSYKVDLEKEQLVRRVVVSDLHLGKGKEGNILKRISAASSFVSW